MSFAKPVLVDRQCPRSRASSTVSSTGNPYVAVSVNAFSAEMSPLRRDLLEETHAARERLGEALFLASQHLADTRAVRLELRVPLAHLVDDDVGEPPQVVEPDLPRLLDGAADDAAEDVTPALVRRDDAVADEAGHPAPVVGEDAMGLRRGFVRVPRNAALLLDPGHDRLVAVGLVDGARGHLLHDRRESLDPHARVDVLLRERRQRAVGAQLVLHEHEVPELEEAVAARACGRAAGIAAAVLLSPVEVDLGVGAARPGPADRPEVLAARAAATMRSSGTPTPPRARPRRSSSPSPSWGSPAWTVTQIRSQSSRRCSRTNSVAQLDRALLEVLPEREVPEHLEEGEVVPVKPDLVDVGRPEALLVVVVSGAGGSSRPRKYGIWGCMPADVSSVEWSSGRGTSDQEGRRLWPFDSK